MFSSRRTCIDVRVRESRDARKWIVLYWKCNIRKYCIYFTLSVLKKDGIGKKNLSFYDSYCNYGFCNRNYYLIC